MSRQACHSDLSDLNSLIEFPHLHQTASSTTGTQMARSKLKKIENQSAPLEQPAGLDQTAQTVLHLARLALICLLVEKGDSRILNGRLGAEAHILPHPRPKAKFYNATPMQPFISSNLNPSSIAGENAPKSWHEIIRPTPGELSPALRLALMSDLPPRSLHNFSQVIRLRHLGWRPESFNRKVLRKRPRETHSNRLGRMVPCSLGSVVGTRFLILQAALHRLVRETIHDQIIPNTSERELCLPPGTMTEQ